MRRCEVRYPAVRCPWSWAPFISSGRIIAAASEVNSVWLPARNRLSDGGIISLSSADTKLPVRRWDVFRALRFSLVPAPLAAVSLPMVEYGLLSFDNLSPSGDHHRIIPSHWIATAGLGPPLHGVEVYRLEPVALFAVHRLDFIKKAM